ncbi:MAG: hypothetical protein IPM71_01330 [Bacteroidota bacterium]|nr:MAG: hypothetical protein IPM71_01330 [Bacteroidota bacterium]
MHFKNINYQNILINYNNCLNEGDEQKVEMLKDILFLEGQTQFFCKNLPELSTIIERKKNKLYKTQSLLEKGIDSFLNQNFVFCNDVIIVKTSYNWNLLPYYLTYKKEIFTTQGEHYYLISPSIFDGIVDEIYLEGWSKIFIDLYHHNDDFTGYDLVEQLLSNNKDLNVDEEKKFIDKVVYLLSSSVVYNNSLDIVSD